MPYHLAPDLLEELQTGCVALHIFHQLDLEQIVHLQVLRGFLQSGLGPGMNLVFSQIGSFPLHVRGAGCPRAKLRQRIRVSVHQVGVARHVSNNAKALGQQRRMPIWFNRAGKLDEVQPLAGEILDGCGRGRRWPRGVYIAGLQLDNVLPLLKRDALLRREGGGDSRGSGPQLRTAIVGDQLSALRGESLANAGIRHQHFLMRSGVISALSNGNSYRAGK